MREQKKKENERENQREEEEKKVSENTEQKERGRENFRPELGTITHLHNIQERFSALSTPRPLFARGKERGELR